MNAEVAPDAVDVGARDVLADQVDLCIRKANEGDEAAVGAMTAFLLGLRASEVTDRVVRDLNDDGRLLWIEFGKTKRSRRTLEVPGLLRPYLLALAKGRAPDAQLISRTISRRSGKKRDRYWLLYHVERLCAEAEVPVVCTQSLRGLHASVATDAGATPHVVASALGHSSPAVTHAHYIDGATARRARTRRVIGKVAPDPALRVVDDESAKAGTRAPRMPTTRTTARGPRIRPCTWSAAVRRPLRHPPPNRRVRAPRGKRATLDEFPESRKGFRPFGREGARGEFSWCPWPDSLPASPRECERSERGRGRAGRTGTVLPTGT